MGFEEGRDREIATVDLLNAEAYAKRHFDPHRARAIAEEALDLSERLGYMLGRAGAVRTLSSVQHQGNDLTGFEGAIESMTIFEAEGDVYGLATAHNLVSCYYYSFRQYDTMLEHLRVAHRLAEELGDQRMQALTLNNMAVASEKVGDYEEAVRLFEHCRIVWSEIRDDLWYWRSTGNMGNALGTLGRLDEARGYLEEALRNLIPHDSVATVEMRLNLAAVYIGLELYDLAVDLIAEAETICEAGEHGLAHSNVYFIRGRLEAKRGHRFASTVALLQARELAVRNNTLDSMQQILRLLAENARLESDFEAACIYLEEFIAFRERVFADAVEARSRSYGVIHRVEWTQKEAHLVRQQNDELQLLNKRLVATLGEKDALHAEMTRQMVTDELTGISNRRHVMEFGRREFERYRRLEAPLAVVMLDIDHFKSINDRFGHAAGDEVLRGIARCIGTAVRTIDAYGRWGGEEFCVVLPGASVETARRIAERIRRSISECTHGDILPAGSVTASCGVASVSNVHRSLDDLLGDADRALYAAKHAGRDRVAIAAALQKAA